MESLILPDEQGALIIFDPCPVEIMWYPQPVSGAIWTRKDLSDLSMKRWPDLLNYDTKKIRPIDIEIKEWDRYTMIYPSHLWYVYYITYIWYIHGIFRSWISSDQVALAPYGWRSWSVAVHGFWLRRAGGGGRSGEAELDFWWEISWVYIIW
jgi:hypothetical protein